MEIKDLCCDFDLKTLIDMPITLVPAIRSAVLHIQLPASKAQVDLFSGGRINVFGGTAQNSGTQFVNGDSTVNFSPCTMLIKGFGVRVSSGVKMFALAGVVFPAGTLAGGCVPAITGAPGPTDPQIAATLNYNQDAAEAIYHFMEGYRLRVLIGCNVELFDERLAHFGSMGSPDSFCGFGTGQTGVQDVINEANTRMAASGCGFTFVSINAAGSGCCGGPAVPLLPLLVPLQWGSACLEGEYGGVFPAPVCLVLTPAMPFQMFLDGDEDSQYHQMKFRQLISCEGETTIGPGFSNILCVPTTTVTATFGATVIDPSTGRPVVVPAGGALPPGSFAVGPGGILSFPGGTAIIATAVPGTTVTVPAGGTTAGIPTGLLVTTTANTPIGKSSVVSAKAGNLDIEFDIIGYDLEPEACLNYFAQYAPFFSPMVRNLYLMNASGWIQGQISSAVARGTVSGIPQTAQELLAPPKQLAAGLASRSDSSFAFGLRTEAGEG